MTLSFSVHFKMECDKFNADELACLSDSTNKMFVYKPTTQ